MEKQRGDDEGQKKGADYDGGGYTQDHNEAIRDESQGDKPPVTRLWAALFCIFILFTDLLL
jgi:hypothetical protein